MEFLFFILGLIIIAAIISAIGEGIAEAKVGEKMKKIVVNLPLYI